MGKEMALRLIAGKSESRAEMALRRFTSLAAKLELSERGPVERIGREAIYIWDRPDLFYPPIRPITLSDRRQDRKSTS